jgi:hypothetical protein
MANLLCSPVLNQINAASGNPPVSRRHRDLVLGVIPTVYIVYLTPTRKIHIIPILQILPILRFRYDNDRIEGFLDFAELEPGKQIEVAFAEHYTVEQAKLRECTKHTDGVTGPLE